MVNGKFAHCGRRIWAIQTNGEGPNPTGMEPVLLICIENRQNLYMIKTNIKKRIKNYTNDELEILENGQMVKGYEKEASNLCFQITLQ